MTSLVAVAKTDENLSEACLETLLEILVQKPHLVVLSGGMRVCCDHTHTHAPMQVQCIIDAVLRSQTQSKNEIVTLSVLACFDHFDTRRFMCPETTIYAILVPWSCKCMHC